MKTYAISDIYGCYDELEYLLNLVEFDNEKDKLICLGDVCDRGFKVKQCFDRLIQIKNLVYIMGNHDLWTIEFLNKKIDRWEEQSWWQQGSRETIQSFKGEDTTIYKDFLNKALPYFIDEQNRVFVHGGFDPDFSLSKHSLKHLVWDRDLYEVISYSKKPIKQYKEVFIGHTPTLVLNNTDKPVNCYNLWCIDTGCFYGGKLTIIDVDTKEFWQTKRI